MTNLLRLGAAAACFAALAGCASSGGPGAAASLPPASGPTSPPAASPTSPPTAGETAAGSETPRILGTTFSSAPTISVSYAPSVAHAETVTVTLTYPDSVRTDTYALSQGPALTLADGITLRTSTAADGSPGPDEITFRWGGRVGRTIVLESATSLLAGPDATPTIPTTGTATFDTKFAGTFGYAYQPGWNGGDAERVVGRGTMTADFAQRSISGGFDDLDFIVDGVPLETTRLGQDLSLAVWADDFQDDGSFTGFAQAGGRGDVPGVIGGGPDMSGRSSGALIGNPGHAPNGIAGVVSLTSTESQVIASLTGGFEGVCACIAPAPDIPTTGVVTFDTVLTGLAGYRYADIPVPMEELVASRADMTVDFGAGTLSGRYDSFKYINQGNISDVDTMPFGAPVGAIQVSGAIQPDGSFGLDADIGGGLVDGSGTAVVTAEPGQLAIAGDFAIGDVTGATEAFFRGGFEGVAR